VCARARMRASSTLSRMSRHEQRLHVIYIMASIWYSNSARWWFLVFKLKRVASITQHVAVSTAISRPTMQIHGGTDPVIHNLGTDDGKRSVWYRSRLTTRAKAFGRDLTGRWADRTADLDALENKWICCPSQECNYDSRLHSTYPSHWTTLIDLRRQT
jgi:hypothetical protein